MKQGPVTTTHFKEGGYGWVMVGVCFCFGFLLVDGYASVSVFMVECVERFHMNEKYLAWIGAFRLSLTGLCGIAVGGLVQRYGHRTMALVGTMLLFCSHVACGLFPNPGFLWLLFTYGIIPGIGFGCLIVVWGTAFQGYFQKKIGIANALVSTGISSGVFIWSPLCEFLFSNYGWTWGLLLKGAIYLHGLPLAMLIFTKKPAFLEMKDAKEHEDKASGRLNPSLSTFKLGSSLISLAFESDLTRSLDGNTLNSCEIGTTPRPCQLYTANCYHSRTNVNNGAHVSVQNSKKQSSAKYSSGALGTSIAHKKGNPILTMIQNAIDFSLFGNIPFLLYGIGLSLVYAGQIAPMVLLPMRAVDNGIDRGPASFLISILGICNLISRLVWGCISDVQRFARYKPLLSGGTAILDGLTSVISFLAQDYISYVIFAGFWGIFSGGYTSLQNTLVAYILQGKNINQGAGTLFTMNGVSWLVSFVFCGLLIDVFGNATSPFFILGGIEVIGGVLICCIVLC